MIGYGRRLVISGDLVQVYPQPMARKKRSSQLLLVHETAPAVCEEIGLNWSQAKSLFEARMLSFNPGASKLLTEKQAKELRFLGVLMATFSSVESLKKIVSSLERPYAYSTSDIYYSWHRHEWLELPQPLTVDNVRELIETLADSEEGEELVKLRKLITDALSRSQSEIQQTHTASPPKKGSQRILFP